MDLYVRNYHDILAAYTKTILGEFEHETITTYRG